MLTSTPMVSIIIPTFNEERFIAATLDSLQKIEEPIEIIVVDGGSTDGTADIVRSYGVHLITSERGRGQQMQAGSAAANGAIFWFLHADTHPDIVAVAEIVGALEERAVVGGNFNLQFAARSSSARFLAWLYPHLRKLRLYYGDSAIFVRAETYREAGGFNALPIFEDLDLVRRLRRKGQFVHLSSYVTTSARRFEGRVFAFTFAHWMFLQVLYWIGVKPVALGKLYRGHWTR